MQNAIPIIKNITFGKFFSYVDNADSRDSERFWIDLYLLIFTVSMAFAIIFPMILSIWGIKIELNQDSVRYLLSSIIQSQAAILAIVVSLTLVAVQFTASAYSPRVIEVFKKHPALWLIVLMYIISISFNSLLLALIPENSILISHRLFILIIFSVTFFICLIGVLIPHIRIIMNQLEILKIIEALINQINVKKIQSESDPFQPAFDVIYGAIRKDDYTTMSSSLKRVCEKFFELMLEKETRWEKSYVSFRFLDDLTRCGLLLLEKNEERFVFEITLRINDLCEFGKKNKDGVVLNDSLEALQKIGVKAVSKNYGHVISNIFAILDNTYPEIINVNEFHNIIDILPKTYETLANSAITNENFYYAAHPLKQLCKYIEESIESNEHFTIVTIGALKRIIATSIIQNKRDIRNSGLRCLYKGLDLAIRKNKATTKEFASYEITQLISDFPDQIPSVEEL